MKNQTKHRHPLLQIAALSVLAGGSLAMGQQRVDRSGANDANNKVGSNGQNVVSNRTPPWQIANDIVNGNVTGGKAFHGRLETGDQGAFRGPTADSVSDRFIRGSSGVSTNGVASNNANNNSVFYGNSRAAPAPAGLVQNGPGGSYTLPTPQAWHTTDPRQQSLSSDVNTSLTPDSNSPGPIDMSAAANTQQGAIFPGALAGQNGGQLSDYTDLKQDPSSQLSPAMLDRMRRLNGSISNADNGTADGQQNNSPNALPSGAIPSGALNNQIPTAGPVSNLNSTGLNGAGPNSNSPNGTAQQPTINNSITPTPGNEPGMVSRFVGPTGDNTTGNAPGQRPGDQGQALRPGQAAESAAKDFNQQVKAKKDAEAKAKADQTAKPGAVKPADNAPAKPGEKPANAPGRTPGNAAAPTIGGAGGDVSGAEPRQAAPRPSAGGSPPMTQTPKMGSMPSAGDKSDIDAMIAKAEGQMRDGKFASAIDTYDAAEIVAPKNGLIKLGRTNAELGGSYYRRAESSLRQTLTADKNLLGQQYDLRSFLGNDRLDIVQKDLSDLVQKNPTDTGAASLLAYVYYNTGNERRAAALLDLADKRAGGKDDFITLLKTNWNFAAPDNK